MMAGVNYTRVIGRATKQTESNMSTCAKLVIDCRNEGDWNLARMLAARIIANAYQQ